MINIDFETFSAAGFNWDAAGGRWVANEGARTTGLPSIGAEVYAMHPSTRVICMAWGGNIWRPGDPTPCELWDHVKRGGLLSAWNSQFEWWVWNEVLHKRLGWPELRLEQILDSMPRARAWSIPGGLSGAAKVMQLDVQKDKRGGQLIRKFCMPRNPTKNNPNLVIVAADDPVAASEFEEYCLQDVAVETELARALPQLSHHEQKVWQLDQEINARGIPVDVEAVDNACEILRQAERVLNAELAKLTGGPLQVMEHSKLAQLQVWIKAQGYEMPDMTADTIKEVIKDPKLPGNVHRALEIRQALGSTSTKKVWAFKDRTAPDGRIYGQFTYCGADRTGRWAGRGIQPHNLPRPDAPVCLQGAAYGVTGARASWNEDTTDQFLSHMKCRNFLELQGRWGDVLKGLSSSLRGMVCASPGHELIGSDYTAIEAVVLAVLAGEQWRVDLFNRKGKLYETSAAKITGRTLAEYAAYSEANGSHHPDRALGKLAELASGYGGSVGAWVKFGAEKFFTPERCEEYREDHARYKRGAEYTLQEFAILKQVWAWREASPMIVKFWRGLEQAAIFAVKHPEESGQYRDIRYHMAGGTLYCTLPSGRSLAYHQARIGPGKFGEVIYFFTNTDRGWVEQNTYGGKLVENVVQAVARCLLAQGMLNVAAAGYKIVMHVHDEIIAEVEPDFGSVEDVERLMGRMPLWATGWPVRAAGGWRGKRFRK